MKTIKKVPFKLVEVTTFPDHSDMEFGKFYYSKEYSTSVHLCACGCGSEVILPINNFSWTISINNSKFSIIPSILVNSDCKSHYVIGNSIANLLT